MKEEEKNWEEYIKNKNSEDKWDVIDKAIISTTPINKILGRDAILAKLEDYEKQFIKSRVDNAMKIKGTITRIAKNYEKRRDLYKKDKEKDIKEVESLATGIEEDYLRDVFTIITLARNNSSNPIMDKIIGNAEKEEIAEVEEDKVKDWIQNKIGKKKDGEKK